MASELSLRLTGGVSNTNPELSLGGVTSSTVVSDVSKNNIFDDVTQEQLTSGYTDYRALDLVNIGTTTAGDITIYITSETTSTDSIIYLFMDYSDLSIVDKTTEPAGASWSHPLEATPLSITDISSSSHARVWFKRVISAGATNLPSDEFQFRIDYA